MKRILFVIPSMRIGGAEKSLANLLNLIDLNEYDINLLIIDTNTQSASNIIPKLIYLFIPLYLYPQYPDINQIIKKFCIIVAVNSINMSIILYSLNNLEIYLSQYLIELDLSEFFLCH